MTFAEFVAAAAQIDSLATVEVQSIGYTHRRSLRFAIYTAARGWVYGDTPSEALARFTGELREPPIESVGEIEHLTQVAS